MTPWLIALLFWGTLFLALAVYWCWLSRRPGGRR